MNRRDLARTMALAAFAAATAKLDVFAATEGGALTADLSQWKFLVFDYGGRRVTIDMSEVFPALEECFGSTPTPAKKGKS